MSRTTVRRLDSAKNPPMALDLLGLIHTDWHSISDNLFRPGNAGFGTY